MGSCQDTSTGMESVPAIFARREKYSKTDQRCFLLQLLFISVISTEPTFCLASGKNEVHDLRSNSYCISVLHVYISVCCVM